MDDRSEKDGNIIKSSVFKVPEFDLQQIIYGNRKLRITDTLIIKSECGLANNEILRVDLIWK
jgi:hypothetical protein